MVTPPASITTKGLSGTVPACAVSGLSTGRLIAQAPKATPPAMAAEPMRKVLRAIFPTLAMTYASFSRAAASWMAARMRV